MLVSGPPYFFGQVMPSQPRSPTRRENSGASVSSRLGLCGSKVPAAISSARKARTSLRSFSHSGGRRIGSKRRAAVMFYLESDADVSLENESRALAAKEARPLSHRERVGVRGYGLSMGRNPSPGSHLSMRSDLSRWERSMNSHAAIGS